MSSKPAVIIVSRRDDPPLNQTVQALTSFRVAHVLIEELHKCLPTVLDKMSTTEAEPIVLLPFFLQLLPGEQTLLEEALQAGSARHPNTTLTLAAPVGYDRRIAEVTEERVMTAAAESSRTPEMPILTMVGADGREHGFAYGDLDALPDHLPDIGARVAGRQGEALPVRVLLDHIGYTNHEGSLVFRSGSDFSAEVSFKQARFDGFLVFKQDNGPLPARFGGPIRLFIPGGDDRCANVKCVDRIEIQP